MNNYRTLILFIFFFGLVLVISEIISNIRETPKERVIYRYIPRTFDEEMDEPVFVSDIFETMFTQPSTWIGGYNDVYNKKRENINQYFASQA